MSCHTSSPRTLAFKTKTDDVERVRVPNGITGYVEAFSSQSQDAWDVRAFGYVTKILQVSLRTANESVEVAVLLNRGTAARPSVTDRVGPGKDCTAVDNAVWECFQDFRNATADCLALCK